MFIESLLDLGQVFYDPLYEGIIFHDAQGRFVSANPAALRILGVTRRRLATLTRNQLEVFCLREDGTPWPWQEQPTMLALRTGEPQRDVVMQVYNRIRKRYRWLAVSVIPLVCRETVLPVRVCTLFNDVTERKEREKQLQEERLSLALRCSDDGFWDWSLERNQIIFSQRWWSMLGYDENEISDDPDILSRTIHPDDQQRVGELLGDLLAGSGDSFEIEMKLRHKLGRAVQVVSRGVVERGADGKAKRLFGTNIDVTKRQQLEYDLRQYQAKLQAANETLELRVRERTEDLEWAIREQEAFSHTVSHDLRAPLRHINSFSAILMEEYAEHLPPEAQIYFDRIRAASNRLGSLIDHLLELSRLTRTEITPEPVHLSELATEVLVMFRETDKSRQVRTAIQEGITVLGDQTLLRQLLENLLGNAWKYTSTRDVATIEFGAVRLPDGEEAFFVRDDGVGFDMEHQQKLFGAFERLHGAEFEGTGVGLATSQRIIKRHGGKIWAEAKVEEGATFYFTLPVYY